MKCKKIGISLLFSKKGFKYTSLQKEKNSSDQIYNKNKF